MVYLRWSTSLKPITMIIIESGDSILWQGQNMSDFNGSLLFFSGKGAAKNNFLMETHLKTSK